MNCNRKQVCHYSDRKICETMTLIHNIVSNFFFQPPRYEEFSSNNFKILYCPNITSQWSSASAVVRSRHVLENEKILGSSPIETNHFFFQWSVILCNVTLYLQQPGIIKMFLLCNIPGKVLFFWYKQDIMRVNCMQNITKYCILLRNVASVLKRDSL
jgi:hypothetical protein